MEDISPEKENLEAEVVVTENRPSNGMHESMISDRSNFDAENTENSIVEDSNLDQTIGDTSAILGGAEEGKKGLNWKKYLKDEKVALDALKFQKGRKNINDDNPAIYKDLPRTRPEDPYFQKASNITALKEIACFYCSSNNINYQQGLLEIIVPFLKLRSATFRTKHCYAYFASFMRNYFPNILIPTIVNDLRELPHLNAAINYCGILLDYHGNQIANILRERDLDLRTFVTPWVMTLFCKGTSMDLVYELFDKYMAQKDKLFLFYMVVALILMNEKEIIDANESGDEVRIITYLNRTLKEDSFKKLEDVERLFEVAKRIKETTPLSFETSLKQIGLMDVGILSIQEFNEYLAQNVQLKLEIYPFEIVNFLLRQATGDVQEKSITYPKTIEFKLLDCRKNKSTLMLPFSIELSEACFKSNETLYAELNEICGSNLTTHFCIIKTNNFDKEEQKFVENVFKTLKRLNKNYVSIAIGGFQAVIKEMEQRKVNIPLIKRKKVSFFDKIFSIFK